LVFKKLKTLCKERNDWEKLIMILLMMMLDTIISKLDWRKIGNSASSFYTAWVNFTNLMVQSVNALIVILWCLWRCSVSPTKVHPTLPVCTTRKCAQLLCFTPYNVRLCYWHKSTSAKSASRMLVKSTPVSNIIITTIASSRM
jgi:hypothetical protein